MNPVTTIRRNASGTYSIYNNMDILIATSSKQQNGWFLVCIVGGKYHGKTTYAQDLDSLSEKSVEISRELF